MGYCTIAEVRDMLKDDYISKIIGCGYVEDPTEREAALTPLIEAAISDAAGEVDGYLAKRYPVPLEPAPKVINKFCKDIAVYNLVSRAGINEQSEEKNYLTRYDAAVKFLRLVAEGTVSIGTGAEGPASAAGTGFTVHASPHVFGRDHLWGM